jgi:hypothetical protein
MTEQRVKFGGILASMATQAWMTFLDACRSIQPHSDKPYRPEAYYMRGPGPKWREKHGSSLQFRP